MKCKFCGCTDRRACRIPMMNLEDDDIVGRSTALPLPTQVAEFWTTCHWSAPNICSAPACIDEAYREACDAVDLMLAAEMAA